jgi:hypothetical protein
MRAKAPRDLPRDKGLPANGRLVVEQHAVARKHAVRLPVVHGDPVSEQFRDGVGRPGIKRRGDLLRDLLHLAEQLRRRRLVELGELFEFQDSIASNTRSVPSASTSAVYSGHWNDTPTWLWAPRL